MTETMIDLPGVIAKSDDADFLRELTVVTQGLTSAARQIDDAARSASDISAQAHAGGSESQATISQATGRISELVGALWVRMTSASSRVVRTRKSGCFASRASLVRSP